MDTHIRHALCLGLQYAQAALVLTDFCKHCTMPLPEEPLMQTSLPKYFFLARSIPEDHARPFDDENGDLLWDGSIWTQLQSENPCLFINKQKQGLYIGDINVKGRVCTRLVHFEITLTLSLHLS